jgi:ubiquinone/menaquinone biosynthesis C-methylase UbiE
MVRTEALVDVMGAAARDYDRVGPAVFAPIAQRLVDFAGMPEAGSVVDVGTGPGIVLVEVAGRAVQPMHLVGIDLSDAMLAEAARRTGHLRARGHRIELHRMDAQDLDLESDSFDLVLCASALYQLAEPAAACREFWRVLRSGGRVGTAVFGQSDPRWQGKNELLAQLAPPMPPIGRRLDEVILRELLDTASFIDIAILSDRIDVAFDDAEAWLAQAWTHGERRALAAMDDVALRRFREQLPRALQPAREDDDKLHWRPHVILARGRKQ